MIKSAFKLELRTEIASGSWRLLSRSRVHFWGTITTLRSK